MSDWMIYGATGYTGVLVAEEAVRRGHRPILAGRSAEKLRPLAERLDLPYVAFRLEDQAAVLQNISVVKVVYHAAGPFVQTSAPMLNACLAAKVHYLDITGEYPVFENTFAHDAEAKAAGIGLISGVGFDVIPTDCLASYVAAQVPNADSLEIAFAAISKASAGTTKSALALMGGGGRIRRDGVLQSVRLGQGARRIRFSDQERTVLPIPWGDLSTAYRTTGIPNITTYMAFPTALTRMMGLGSSVMDVSAVLRNKTINGMLRGLTERFVDGPNEVLRRDGKSYIWARAANTKGESAQAWLETSEGYVFTAAAGVRVVERVLSSPPIGATTPALAFGADFVLEIPGTTRFDNLA